MYVRSPEDAVNVSRQRAVFYDRRATYVHLDLACSHRAIIAVAVAAAFCDGSSAVNMIKVIFEMQGTDRVRR